MRAAAKGLRAQSVGWHRWVRWIMPIFAVLQVFRLFGYLDHGPPGTWLLSLTAIPVYAGMAWLWWRPGVVNYRGYRAPFSNRIVSWSRVVAVEPSPSAPGFLRLRLTNGSLWSTGFPVGQLDAIEQIRNESTRGSIAS